MDTYLPQFLDNLFRRHAALMWASVLIAAALACWIMIGSGGPVLVYEGF